MGAFGVGGVRVCACALTSLIPTPTPWHNCLVPSRDRRVFSGYDRATKARVAIKKLLLPVDCQLPATVTREIKILKQLRHYNIVKLIDVVTSKGTRYEGGRLGLFERAWHGAAFSGTDCRTTTTAFIHLIQ